MKVWDVGCGAGVMSGGREKTLNTSALSQSDIPSQHKLPDLVTTHSHALADKLAKLTRQDPIVLNKIEGCTEIV
jgi:hypothetical protein